MKSVSYGESYSKKLILKTNHSKDKVINPDLRTKEKSAVHTKTQALKENGSKKLEVKKSITQSPAKRTTKFGQIRTKLKPLNSIVKVSTISIASKEENLTSSPQINPTTKPVFSFADLYNMSSKEYSNDLCRELDIKERPLSQISEVHPLTKGYVYNKDPNNISTYKMSPLRNTVLNTNNISRFSNLKDVSQEEKNLLAEIQSLTLHQNQKLNKIYIQSDPSVLSHQSSFSMPYADTKKLTPLKVLKPKGDTRLSAPLKERKESTYNRNRNVSVPIRTK